MVDKKTDTSNVEAQRLIDEARELVNSVLGQLKIGQLVGLNGYMMRVQRDYDEQDERWRNRSSDEEVPSPRYRKVDEEEFSKKSWWGKIQPLFSDNDGRTMSGLVESEVRRYIHEKARDDPYAGFVERDE